MERRSWLILFAICLVVAPITFSLGRLSRSEPRSSEAYAPHFGSEVRLSEKSQRTSETETANLAPVRIENLGDIEFDEAYHLLRSAPKDWLLRWTKRLEELPVAPRKTAAINTFFKTLVQIDAKIAVDLALGMDRADPRWTAIGAVNAAAPAANLSEVARMYLALNERDAPLGDLFENWSAINPEATARFISIYPGKVETGDVDSLLWNWAALDPAGAAGWLAKADSGRRVPEVYAGFYNGWMLHDRATALTDLAAHSADKTFQKAIETVSENLFTDSTEAARGFILTLPDRAAQEAAVNQITGHITGIYLGSGDPLDLKPEEVAKWLLTLPDNLWPEQIGPVLDRWADQDRPSLDAWYNQMPPQKRDCLLAEQCRAFNWNLPTAGLQAGLRISDPELRLNTFRQIFKDKAEEVKQDFLREAQLSAEESAELRRILKHL